MVARGSGLMSGLGQDGGCSVAGPGGAACRREAGLVPPLRRHCPAHHFRVRLGVVRVDGSFPAPPSRRVAASPGPILSACFRPRASAATPLESMNSRAARSTMISGSRAAASARRRSRREAGQAPARPAQAGPVGFAVAGRLLRARRGPVMLRAGPGVPDHPAAHPLPPRPDRRAHPGEAARGEAAGIGDQAVIRGHRPARGDRPGHHGPPDRRAARPEGAGPAGPRPPRGFDGGIPGRA